MSSVTIWPMNPSVILLSLLVYGCVAFAKDGRTPAPLPDQFLIARHTFIDVGPPNDFYEIILVRGTAADTVVERATLTPAGNACMQPASLEMTFSPIPEPINVVLEDRNPCAIPDKALRRELKRRKQGLVFSGAEVSMQIQCGGKERIIRTDVLDRDMFDPNASTPENTSWTMRVLDRLDKAFASGVWDRPVFPSSDEPTGATAPSSDLVKALASGEFDHLFSGAPDRPSDLYRASQIKPPAPEILLSSSVPFQPEKFVQPDYPPMAKLARIEGAVVATFQVDANGGVTDIQFDSGHPVFRPAVTKAISEWKFSKQAAGQQIKATLDFKTNCPPKPR